MDINNNYLANTPIIINGVTVYRTNSWGQIPTDDRSATIIFEGDDTYNGCSYP